MSKNQTLLLVGALALVMCGCVTLGLGIASFALGRATTGVNLEATSARNNPIPNQTPMKGLVAYYPFNGNANDESGNGHHGTVLGTVLTEDRLGKTDSAYSFDGKDNYIEVAHDASLNPTEEISLAAWIWARQYEFYPAVVNKGNVGTGNESYSLYLTPEGKLGCLLNRDGTPGGRTANELGPAIPLKTWTHVACTYDGETIRTYINADEVGKKPHTGGIFITPDPVLIGKSERLSSNYPTTFFDGSIDEVEIYSRSLLPEEIRALADVDR